MYYISTPGYRSIHSSRPPTPVPAFTVFPPSNFSLGISRPLQLCAASPSIPPLPSSNRPPFTSLAVASVPVEPCGCSPLGYFLPLPFLVPPPAGLNLQNGHCWSQGGLCIQSLSSCSHPLCFVFTCSCADPYLCVSWWFFFVWATFYVLTRGMNIYTPWQSPAPSLFLPLLGRAGDGQLPPLLVPLVLLIPLSSVLLGHGVISQWIILLTL